MTVTVHHNYHTTERTHVPRRPCFNEFFQRLLETVSEGEEDEGQESDVVWGESPWTKWFLMKKKNIWNNTITMFNNVTKTPQFASALIGCDTISRDQNCTPAVSKWLPHAAEIAAFRSWQHDTYADGRYRKAWNMIQTPIMQPMWKIVTFIDVGWAEQRKVSGACGGQISLPVLAQQMVVGAGVDFHHWHVYRCKQVYIYMSIPFSADSNDQTNRQLWGVSTGVTIMEINHSLLSKTHHLWTSHHFPYRIS